MRWFKQHVAFLSFGFGVFLYIHFMPRFTYVVGWSKHESGHWVMQRWPKWLRDIGVNRTA